MVNQSMWPVVKDLCDHGYWEVVLVRCEKTGRILAYCRDCMAAWLAPADLDRGFYVIASRECPDGIAVPSQEQVTDSPWAGAVIQFVPGVEFFTTATEINEDLDRERLRPFRPVGSVGGSRSRATKFEIVCSALPIGLMLSSFVPLWYIARTLAYLLNIPDNVPVKDQPNGLLWMVLLYVSMLLLMLTGVLAGFVLNALILRYALGWTWTEVQASGAVPRIPTHWTRGRSNVMRRLVQHQRGRNPMHDSELDDLS